MGIKTGTRHREQINRQMTYSSLILIMSISTFGCICASRAFCKTVIHLAFSAYFKLPIDSLKRRIFTT